MINASTDRQQAIQSARAVLDLKPVFLDTETTGLNLSDEVVEIAIIDFEGQVLADSFVRPKKPIPPDATRIHNITNQMVMAAQTWPVLWVQKIRPILIGKMIVAYNAEFDLRMMQQSYEQYQMAWREKLQSFDLLKLYSRFRGEWDGTRREWKYFSLDEAGKASGISLPNAHRAMADTLLARELLLFIAKSS
jgi:DNA polymerase-3 subunit epsilon